MAEELYEELPADGIEEELYEDLPDSAYEAANQYPIPTPVSPSYNTGGAPPPLPTGPIPQYRPGASPPPTQSAPPPLPTRASTTTISTSQTLPPPRKQEKAKPPAKKKGGPPPKAPPRSGGGGGINMSEILQKARGSDRSHALEQLENKGKSKDDSEEKVVPWANQLRKTPRPKDDDSAPPPWVKKNSPIETEPAEEMPEFIRKARTLSRTEADMNGIKPPSPKTDRKPPPTTSKPPPSPRPSVAGNKPAVGHKPAVKPPPVAKPRHVPSPEGFQPKVAKGPEASEKPAWLKQRERQVNLAKGETSQQDDGRPPSPTMKPPGSLPNGPTTTSPQPPVVKKPPPKPSPRKPPAEVPPPISIKPTNEPITTQESPPTTPSVRERARTLERGAKQRVPTPPESPIVPVPPRGNVPPPVQPSPSLPSTPQPATPAPPPAEERVLPNRSPPSTRPPPPMSAPPPSSEPSMPPLPDRPPPTNRPPSLSDQAAVPPLPSRPPPTTRPQTHAEPTPPTGPVLLYRRRTLPLVDAFSPPPRPPVTTKPADFLIPELGEDEEIYDDTVGFIEDQNGEFETDEVYDDVTQLDMNQPSPPSPQPPLPVTLPPGPPTSAPPPLPASLPPSSRPSITTIGPDDPQVNGIHPISNGDLIPEEDQETYEDLESAAEAYATAQSSLHSPSVTSFSSLIPPSPQHLSSSPGGSPTLDRKKLSKKQQKEEEKEKKRLEKERKKKEEARMKNKLKGLKTYKQFELKLDVEPLFAVEILLDHLKTKDHLNVAVGEVARVLLINHPKLPGDRYLIEKEDGNIGYLKKNICQRTAYQSAASVLDVPPQPAAQAFQDDDDIYESLPQGEDDFPDALQSPMPSLPPPNPSRFPPPSQPAPPPPPTDGPEDNYEYLPEPQMVD